VGKGGATRPLKYLDEFVAWAERPEAHLVTDGDVVFVGYGVRAPEWQWDDYKDTDVRGKVLLMLVNDPGLQDSTVFNGKALTYYGRWTYKLEEAARRGALGAILIHTTESATYPWDVVRGSWSVEQFKLDRAAPQGLAFAAWVAHGAAQSVLAQAGLKLDSLVRVAGRRDFRPVATGRTSPWTSRAPCGESNQKTWWRNCRERSRSREPSRDVHGPLGPQGHRPAVNGDSIYNGAEDNASALPQYSRRRKRWPT